jgi:hypothetical protein
MHSFREAGALPNGMRRDKSFPTHLFLTTG